MSHVAMIVSNPCDPDPRVEKEGAALVEAGYDVTIHAFDREEMKAPESTVDGVRIIRHRVGKTPRGAPNLATGAKVLLGLRKFRKKVIRNLLENPPEIIHCHDADTLAVGIKIKSKLGTTLVFDMHDLAHTWARMERPYSIIRHLISKIIERRLVRRIKYCDLVVTSSGAVSGTSHPGFREWVRKRRRKTNVVVVENRPLPSGEKKPIPERFTIGYAGKIREITMFENLIKAVESWPNDDIPKLLIAGHGTAEKQVDSLLSISNLEVERINQFSRSELPLIIGKMSIMYAVYPTLRGNILDGALPTKMFDAAIHGRPSIVNSGCLMGDIATAEKIGVTVDSSDVESLLSALLKISKQHSEIKLERDWTGEAKRLVLAYAELGNGS